MKRATFDELLASMNEALEHAHRKGTLRTTPLSRPPAPQDQAQAIGSDPADGRTRSDARNRKALTSRSSAARNLDRTDSD